MPQCKYCSGEYTRITYHENYCKQNPDKKHYGEHSSYFQDTELKCKFCNKIMKNENSRVQHELRCSKNPNHIEYEGNLKNRGWNKGLTKHSDQRVKNLSDSLKEYYKEHTSSWKGQHHTEFTKQHLSMVQTEIDHSSHGRNSHGKHGYYNNVYFMSTWELAYYIYMTDLGHVVQRCADRYPYFINNKKHYYTPDFITDGRVVEIKGWESELDKLKYTLVENIQVLYYNDIKPMVEYVQQKYNISNIEDLYLGD